MTVLVSVWFKDTVASIVVPSVVFGWVCDRFVLVSLVEDVSTWFLWSDGICDRDRDRGATSSLFLDDNM